MNLNGIMAVTLCYFTEFGKPVFQDITTSICGGIYVVFCSACMMSFVRKFTFDISSPDNLVIISVYHETKNGNFKSSALFYHI